MLPFDPRRARPGLLLPGLIQRPDRQRPPAPPPPRRLVQPRHREPPHRGHRCHRVPGRPVQQALGPVRRPVTREPRDRPPVPPRQIAHHRSHVLPGLKPRPRPPERRADQLQQLSPFPQAQPYRYPGGSSRLRLLFRHTNMIMRRLPHS